jgi:hypothetical protein
VTHDLSILVSSGSVSRWRSLEGIDVGVEVSDGEEKTKRMAEGWSCVSRSCTSMWSVVGMFLRRVRRDCIVLRGEKEVERAKSKMEVRTW